MRFRRSSLPQRATGKSNCDSSRYRCASFHRGRIIQIERFYTARPQSLQQLSRTRSHFFPSSFSACRFHSPCTSVSPLFYCPLPSVSFLLCFSPRWFCRPITIAFCQSIHHTSLSFIILYLLYGTVQIDVFLIIMFLSSYSVPFRFSSLNSLPWITEKKKTGMKDRRISF